MKQVILAGNAITASILYSYLIKDPRYKVVGLTVDVEYSDEGSIETLPTVPISQLNEHYKPHDCVVIMAMGYNNLNQSRESMYLRLKEKGYAIETYIHPDACVYTQHIIGEGSVVLPSAVVEPHVHVGVNTMLWCNVTLAHHCSVMDHCWVASGAVISGQAKVERNSFIGVNATVINEVVIGEYNVIGGGALITRSTNANAVHLARSGEEHRFSSQDYEEYFGV